MSKILILLLLIAFVANASESENYFVRISADNGEVTPHVDGSFSIALTSISDTNEINITIAPKLDWHLIEPKSGKIAVLPKKNGAYSNAASSEHTNELFEYFKKEYNNSKVSKEKIRIENVRFNHIQKNNQLSLVKLLTDGFQDSVIVIANNCIAETKENRENFNENMRMVSILQLVRFNCLAMLSATTQNILKRNTLFTFAQIQYA